MLCCFLYVFANLLSVKRTLPWVASPFSRDATPFENRVSFLAITKGRYEKGVEIPIKFNLIQTSGVHYNFSCYDFN